MSIKSGRNGTVKYTRVGTSPGAVTIISLNAWDLSYSTDFEEVTSFGDGNRVYVPGLPDLSGNISGFWNSALPGSLILIDAAKATSPGLLEFEPNSTEPGNVFEGLAYLDFSINCTLGAPKVTSKFRAAGTWALPGSP